MRKIKDQLLYVLSGACLVAGVFLLYKATKAKEKPFSSIKFMESVHSSVKYPERLLLSPDQTNKGSFQLSYTFLTQSSQEESKNEVLTVVKNLVPKIMANEKVTTLSVVGFNSKLKQPLRIVVGRDYLIKNPQLLTSNDSIVNSLSKDCPQTTPKNLKGFCNISMSFKNNVQVIENPKDIKKKVHK